ncbi:MAG: heavy metal translocating P-type ATPase [Caldilineaceae bacterium]
MTSLGQPRTITPAEQAEYRALQVDLALAGLGIVGMMAFPPFAALSMIGFLYRCIFDFRLAYEALVVKRKADVNVLVAVSIATLAVTNHYILGNFINSLFDLSRILVLKVQHDTKHSFVDVFKQQHKWVWIRLETGEVEIPFADLQIGQVVVVAPGETLPVDGVIVEGAASIDQHILTGEFQAAEKSVGDKVFASTVVLAGKIYIQVEKTGADTTVAQIGELLNRTIDYKAKTQLRAEVMADKTVVPMLIVGLITWPLLGLLGAVAVVNAHFKHKMAILGPIGMLNYLHIASQQGILIKDGRTFDLMNTIDTVVFDKTGTLTHAHPTVGHIYGFDGYHEEMILAYAAAAEQKQSHPIAVAIRAEAQQRQLVLPVVDEAAYKVGYGLTLRFNDTVVRVGSTRFLAQEGIGLAQSILQLQEACHDQGYSLVLVAISDQVVGGLELRPTLRPEAKTIIQQLRAQGVTSIYILSGDHTTPTRKLAEELGVDHYFAEVLPQDKAVLIEQLQAKGQCICFVGDGLNDSIALKKAHVSVSLRGASAIAMDTAQVILMDESLTQLPKLLAMSRSFERNLQTTFVLQVLPTCLCIAGIFAFHWSFLASVVWNQVGLVSGLYNTMLPLRQTQREEHIHATLRLTT